MNKKHSRRTRIAAAAGVALVAVTTATAAPAYAAPGNEPSFGQIFDAAGDYLQHARVSNMSSEAPSLFGLFSNDSPDVDRQSKVAQRRTSCTSVVQIGDSTSVESDDTAKVANSDDRISAQYKRVGAKTVTLNASRGRSVVERVDGKPNALEAIDAELSRGKRGCWVIAMGVNDAAHIADGSLVSARERIDGVMRKLDGQKVLWPTVMTTNPVDERYDKSHMAAFDDALKKAAGKYTNLHVYDFASETQPFWYSDGVHYTATGTVQRNRLFAAALATAYPQQ
ncbi:SGNH/GDSL hydrolase family protein [Gordonia zhaorongruii]|uniref:SGNH/GDSL hydrolase family protein n=1 Tax=Gordonia zhaorongruii TaxID=2597659 RepID=UPI001F3F7A7D|nr:SGNH/GDSL hydrolase family protein [Gordonia zhaorongruii]